MTADVIRDQISQRFEQVLATGESTMPIGNPKKTAWRAFKIQPDGRLKSVEEIKKKALMLLR